MLMRGLRRRDRLDGLRGGMASRALDIRGLPAPMGLEIDTAEGRAAHAMPLLMRLELLTALIGDLVELCVNLDRACLLEEAGLRTDMGRLFARSASPRNLAILAERS